MPVYLRLTDADVECQGDGRGLASATTTACSELWQAFFLFYFPPSLEIRFFFPGAIDLGRAEITRKVRSTPPRHCSLLNFIGCNILHQKSCLCQMLSRFMHYLPANITEMMYTNQPSSTPTFTWRPKNAAGCTRTTHPGHAPALLSTPTHGFCGQT